MSDALAPTADSGNKMAVAAVTLGSLGVLAGLTLVLFFLAVLFGLLAIIFGFIGRQKGRPRRGAATVGVAVGAIALTVGILGGLIVADYFCMFGDSDHGGECDRY